MRLSPGSTFDQIDLPASNDSILAAYTAAQEHMHKIMDGFLDHSLHTPNLSAIPEEEVYKLFSIPFYRSMNGEGQYGDTEKNKPMTEKIAVIRGVMRNCLHARGYELTSSSHRPFGVTKLEEYILENMQSDARRIKPEIFEKNPRFIEEEVQFRARKVIESA